MVRDPTNLEITGPGLSRVLDQNFAATTVINKSINRPTDSCIRVGPTTISDHHGLPFRNEDQANRRLAIVQPKSRLNSDTVGVRSTCRGWKADKIVRFWSAGGPMTWLIVGRHRYFEWRVFPARRRPPENILQNRPTRKLGHRNAPKTEPRVTQPLRDLEDNKPLLIASASETMNQG